MRKGDEIVAMASAMRAFVPHVEPSDPAYWQALALLAYNALAEHRRKWLRETIAEHMRPWLRDGGIPPRHEVLAAADRLIDRAQKDGVHFVDVSPRDEVITRLDEIIDSMDPRHCSGINRSSAPYWKTGVSDKAS